jgi:hypothetical protein
MPPRRSVLGAVALVLLLVACDDPTVDGAVDPAATATTAEGSPTIRPELTGADDAVLVLGDSLTVGASTMGGLEGRLRGAGFDEVEVIAEEGRDTDWGLGEVEALDAVPPTVVVALGTNRSANPDGFAEVVAEVVAALRARGAVRIAWITPVFATDDRYQEKIDVLEAADGIDLVADWAEVVHDDPAIVSGDGLHPTEPGYGRLARFLADAAADVAG